MAGRTTPKRRRRRRQWRRQRRRQRPRERRCPWCPAPPARTLPVRDKGKGPENANGSGDDANGSGAGGTAGVGAEISNAERDRARAECSEKHLAAQRATSGGGSGGSGGSGGGGGDTEDVAPPSSNCVHRGTWHLTLGTWHLARWHLTRCIPPPPPLITSPSIFPNIWDSHTGTGIRLRAWLKPSVRPPPTRTQQH